MTAMDEPIPAANGNDPNQPIGRVNMRSADADDMGGGWSLRAILFGIVAIAIMLLTLLIVLPWALEPLPA